MAKIIANMLEHSSPAAPKYLMTQKRISTSDARISLVKSVPREGVTWSTSGVTYHVYKFE